NRFSRDIYTLDTQGGWKIVFGCKCDTHVPDTQQQHDHDKNPGPTTALSRRFRRVLTARRTTTGSNRTDHFGLLLSSRRIIRFRFLRSRLYALFRLGIWRVALRLGVVLIAQRCDALQHTGFCVELIAGGFRRVRFFIVSHMLYSYNMTAGIHCTTARNICNCYTALHNDRKYHRNLQNVSTQSTPRYVAPLDFWGGVNVRSCLVIFIVSTPGNTELTHVLMSSKETHDEFVFTRTGGSYRSRNRTVTPPTIGANSSAPVE